MNRKYQYAGHCRKLGNARLASMLRPALSLLIGRHSMTESLASKAHILIANDHEANLELLSGILTECVARTAWKD